MYYTNNVIRVKKESFALRCEICHQTDCFEREKNYCSRCQTAFSKPVEEKKAISISLASYIVYLLMNLSITTLSYYLLQAFIVKYDLLLFFFPMTAITSLLFPFNYKYLVSKSTFGRKVFVFYSTFLIALLIYGAYLCAYMQPIHLTPMEILRNLFLFEAVSLAFGHICGLPTLAFMIFINNFYKKFLFGQNEVKERKFLIKQTLKPTQN